MTRKKYIYITCLKCDPSEAGGHTQRSLALLQRCQNIQERTQRGSAPGKILFGPPFSRLRLLTHICLLQGAKTRAETASLCKNLVVQDQIYRLSSLNGPTKLVARSSPKRTVKLLTLLSPTCFVSASITRPANREQLALSLICNQI